MSRQWTTQNAHFPSQPRAVKGWLYPPHSFGRMSINFDNALTMFHDATSRRTDGHAACYPLCISLRWSRWRHSPSQRLTVIWSKGFYEPIDMLEKNDFTLTSALSQSVDVRDSSIMRTQCELAMGMVSGRAPSEQATYECSTTFHTTYISSRQYNYIFKNLQGIIVKILKPSLFSTFSGRSFSRSLHETSLMRVASVITRDS